MVQSISISHHLSYNMDLDWLWLIIPGGYILLSLLCLCLAPFHRGHYPNPLLNTLATTRQLLCIGHRGGGFEGPENTLELFRQTAPLSHMFELDVCETLDHQLVVHHDTRLNRTTGVDRAVNEFRAEELPPFQPSIEAFGAVELKIVKTTNNRIPLLEELFAEFPDRLMNIDLKTPSDTAVQEFARLVRKHSREGSTVWGSMGESGCSQLREAHPGTIGFYSGWEIFKIFLLTLSGLLPFWPLRHGVLDIPLRTASMNQLAGRMVGTGGRKVAVCVALGALWFFNLLSRLFIPHLRRRGILTFYWILNEREDWETAVSMGCNGIMTDEPTRLSQFLMEKRLYFQLQP